ncbi:class I SAM-dependent methyltransferase [Xanthomonas euvesicatoria]
MSSYVRAQLGQYMTPYWAAEAIVEEFFPSLGAQDLVLEPTCGDGAFLRAIPAEVPAIGVELDASLARVAAVETGRRVIVGDIRTVDIPVQPTHFLGNPPFHKQLVDAILERAWQLLPLEGRVGLILPCSVFQTASTIEQLSEKWSIEQRMLPRNLFPGLQAPLCFVDMRKGAGGKLVGFALYSKVHAVSKLERRYRALLQSGERSSWAAVTRAAMEVRGGTATLQELYREIAGFRPTTNQWWQAKVRQCLRMMASRVSAGLWKLNSYTPAASAA